ncbi:hypothetical protein D3C72_1351340 [compost metagenome]
MVGCYLIFPLAIASQHIVNLSSAFKTDTHIGFIAIITGIVREIVQCFYAAVKIKFVAVFIVDFCCLCCLRN